MINHKAQTDYLDFHLLSDCAEYGVEKQEILYVIENNASKWCVLVNVLNSTCFENSFRTLHISLPKIYLPTQR